MAHGWLWNFKRGVCAWTNSLKRILVRVLSFCFGLELNTVSFLPFLWVEIYTFFLGDYATWFAMIDHKTQIGFLCFVFWILAMAVTFFFSSRAENSFHGPPPTWTIYNGENFHHTVISLFIYSDSAVLHWTVWSVPHWQDV